MFDTHCHLNFEAFQEILEDAIDRARKSGVEYLVIPSTDLETSKKALYIAEIHKNIFAGVGIHPTKDLEILDLKSMIFKLTELAENEKVVAIGEIGLDYYHFKSPASTQKTYFEEQLKLAMKLGKPVIIHNRHAGEDIIKILDKNWRESLKNKCVFHCCEADNDMLAYAIKQSIYIGVDGDVTYDKKKQEFVKKIPMELLLSETDSPYIIPEPLRSQKVFPNEPQNVRIILKTISELKVVDFDDLVGITTRNAKQLFGLY